MSGRAADKRTRVQRASVAFLRLATTEQQRILIEDYGMTDVTLDTDFIDMLTFIRESGQREAFLQRFGDSA